ncbi:MAG: bifunctional DNA-formamidopyrimidine glycosylase/DNA-(apurinic or apyrimidinic site) lyase [Gammaproteobacteria bacterium]|nr:bifunctional DNA-formamidopyrimidine glycosylase/DNA-(apurinic or apyrimidinic site) lyase [Gammaproteobacteria bacterium]
MPELPEVETIRRGIEPHLRGRIIRGAIVREPRLRRPVPDSFAESVSGKTVQTVGRRGKYLLFDCACGHILIHLGMSGTLRIAPAKLPPQKHDHLDLVFRHGVCLRYRDPRRFGSVLWTQAPIREHPLLANLGPEPLSNDFTGKFLYASAKKRQQAIKIFIMDSRNVTGVGNIYANEALFLAGIHPACPAGQLSLQHCRRIVKAIRKVLRTAIAQGGSTLRDFTDHEGNPGYFTQSLQVYGRAGEACVQCGGKIQRLELGQRASYFCPVCQQSYSLRNDKKITSP